MVANLLDAHEATYRPVVGCPGYRVGDDGSVWSCWVRKVAERDPATSRIRRTARVMSDTWHRVGTKPVNDLGYYRVCLFTDGRKRQAFVQELVLEAFVGPRPPGLEACHDDNDPANNRLTNLRWDTHKGNVADKRRHGTHQAGETHPRSRLTEADVREIRTKYRFGWSNRRCESNRHLAAKFGITPRYLWAVATGRSWSHV